MKVASAHTTPVTARELCTFLHRRGATITHGNSSHIRITFANGERATMVATQEHVSAVVLRGVADKLGLSYRELRAELGYPIQNKGKPRATTLAALPKTASKGDVHRTALAVRNELRAIETDATSRDRDPSVTAKAHATMLTALRTLEGYSQSYATARRHAQ